MRTRQKLCAEVASNYLRPTNQKALKNLQQEVEVTFIHQSLYYLFREHYRQHIFAVFGQYERIFLPLDVAMDLQQKAAKIQRLPGQKPHMQTDLFGPAKPFAG